MFKELVDRILSVPRKRQLKLNFDLKRRVFCLSIPVYDREVSLGIKEYVEKRKGKTFKPHKTFFVIRDEKVWLVQEVPFVLGFQDTVRRSMYQFLAMSRNCRKMFTEMVVEEKYATLDSLLESE